MQGSEHEASDRHRRHLTECANHLDMFLSNTLPMDLAAEELRYAAATDFAQLALALALMCAESLVVLSEHRNLQCLFFIPSISSHTYLLVHM